MPYQRKGRQYCDFTAHTKLSNGTAFTARAKDCGCSSQYVWRRFGGPCVGGSWSESGTLGNSRVQMTRESWPFSGPGAVRTRRAGYRSTRLKVVTDFGGDWASGTKVGRGGLRPDGPSREKAGTQADAIVAVSPAL